MDPLALIKSGLDILGKWIPDGTKRAEIAGQLAVEAIRGLGWAQKWLAMIFGTALAVYIVGAVLVAPMLGKFLVIQWWAILLLLSLTWVLLGRSIKDLFRLWDRVKDERDGK